MHFVQSGLSLAHMNPTMPLHSHASSSEVIYRVSSYDLLCIFWLEGEEIGQHFMKLEWDDFDLQ